MQSMGHKKLKPYVLIPMVCAHVHVLSKYPLQRCLLMYTSCSLDVRKPLLACTMPTQLCAPWTVVQCAPSASRPHVSACPNINTCAVCPICIMTHSILMPVLAYCKFNFQSTCLHLQDGHEQELERHVVPVTPNNQNAHAG